MSVESATSVSGTALAGSVSWFEVGSADPEAAQAFYGRMFGWSFAPDEGSGGTYRIVTTGPGHPISGGIFDTAGAFPSYAVFCVVVPDVAAACVAAAELGGSVISGPVTTGSGLVFAHLQDPDGNHFGIYSPPPGETASG
jgi:predicted enzyme related to lactoylglutathione lyase